MHTIYKTYAYIHGLQEEFIIFCDFYNILRVFIQKHYRFSKIFLKCPDDYNMTNKKSQICHSQVKIFHLSIYLYFHVASLYVYPDGDAKRIEDQTL